MVYEYIISHNNQLFKRMGRPRGRSKTTYLQVIKTQLKEKHFQTLEDAMMEAKTEKGGEQSSRTQAF